jgi:seryl-tRNA synthetase
MIDRTLLRENAASVKERIHQKEPSFDIDRLIYLELEQGRIQREVEQIRHQKNELAQRGKQGIAEQMRAQAIELGKQLKEKERLLKHINNEFQTLYLACPNVPDTDLPIGGKDANKIIKSFGHKPVFAFEPKNHVELGTVLGWFDFERAALMTGSQFPLYKDQSVKLMYALTMFMLKHNMQYDYVPILPPYLVNEKSLIVASNFPKFKDQVYAVPEDDLYLIPTAEVSLANLYRDQILTHDQLPLRFTSWTSCFRREAGGYGAHERGLIRVHQFEKVELFTLCEPERSREEHERMLACAEGLLQALNLHYRVSLLATQDCSFPSARTYDLEVWMPGQKAYYEVSSVSNCTDFQARRGAIRYRKTATTKLQLVHTLNGSSVALSRLMVALMETYQQADGSVIIPSCLEGQGIW